MSRTPLPTRTVANVCRGVLRHLGLDVRRYRPHPYRPATLVAEPRTILDVGAADGTPELYDAFPKAFLVAFEPIAEQLARLGLLLGDRPAEFVTVALGNTDGKLELTIDTTNALKSSFHSRTPLTSSSGTTVGRCVDLRTLDQLAKTSNWQPPFALKIDTEGHELAILQGAPETLKRTAVLYCETTVGRRFEQGYQFSDVASLLFDRGFELVDVLTAPRGRDGRTLFLDTVWTPRVATTQGSP